MYRTLLDQCSEVFDIRESSAVADSLYCHGDPAGIACNCAAKSSDFLVTLRTPQQYGRQPPPQEVQYWQDRRRRRKQTTGFLHVGRLATLLQNRKARVAIWEITSMLGLGLLKYLTGYHDGDMNIAVSKMLDAERFEGLTYEFELAGKSNFDFSVL